MREPVALQLRRAILHRDGNRVSQILCSVDETTAGNLIDTAIDDTYETTACLIWDDMINEDGYENVKAAYQRICDHANANARMRL